MQKEILGTFDGEHFKAEDGKRYPVPGNYASKSNLVEGDGLKLTISERGKFFYKQINLVERKRFIGRIVEEDGKNKVINEKGKTFGILSASISYYKLKPDDEVIAAIPEGKDCYYATIEMKTNE